MQGQRVMERGRLVEAPVTPGWGALGKLVLSLTAQTPGDFTGVSEAMVCTFPKQAQRCFL